jgi:hypothetical protein
MSSWFAPPICAFMLSGGINNLLILQHLIDASGKAIVYASMSTAYCSALSMTKEWMLGGEDAVTFYANPISH